MGEITNEELSDLFAKLMTKPMNIEDHQSAGNLREFLGVLMSNHAPDCEFLMIVTRGDETERKMMVMGSCSPREIKPVLESVVRRIPS